MTPARWSRSAPQRLPTVELIVDEAPLPAVVGETVAAAMLAAGHPFDTDGSGAQRAPFCNMGTCYECIVTIDGRALSRACLIPAVDGMTVATSRRM